MSVILGEIFSIYLFILIEINILTSDSTWLVRTILNAVEKTQQNKLE